jgi:zinc transport system substrate-binding protein
MIPTLYRLSRGLRLRTGVHLIGLGAIASLIAFSCSPDTGDVGKTKLHVFVSIPPQAFFVEKIGGERAEVEVLLAPGQSPATYEMTPQQMARLSKADLFFSIGVPFEKQLLRQVARSLGELDIVDTGEGIELRPISGHRHKGEVLTGALDPHIWLDPKLVKVQADHIASALSAVDPANEESYRRNLAAFIVELDSVDLAIRELLTPLRNRTIHVFHPAYGYFTDAYGLHQEAIEIEGKEPSARELARIIEEAKENGVKTLFVQPQFSREQAQVIAAEIGGEVVALDPLARDYMNNLWDIATKIRTALGEGEIPLQESGSLKKR